MAKKRPDAFATDIKRTITGNLKRFISLFIITALGATMLVGLKAACDDVRLTADDYYDSQHLFDIQVQSTLGLDAKDIAAIARVDGVDEAAGGYTETAYTQVNGSRQKVDLKALLSNGINEPLLLEGRMPRDAGEVAVTNKYLKVSGKKVGDKITFEGMDDDAPDARPAVFERGTYKIVAAVMDPMDVNAASKTVSFRAGSGSQFAFFFTPAAVIDRDTYTVAYATVKDARGLSTYSEAYDERIDAVKAGIEDIREKRERARTQGIRDDAEGQIAEQEGEVGRKLDAAREELSRAQGTVDEGSRKLADAERALAQGSTEVSDGLAQLAAGLGCSVDGIPGALAARQSELDAAQGQLAQVRTQLVGAGSMLSGLPYVGGVWPQDAWARLVSAPDVSAAQAAAAEVSAAIDPFVASSVQSLDGMIELVRSDEFHAAMDQAHQALDQLPQDIKDRIEAQIAQAPQGVQDAIRAALARTPEDMATQLTSMKSQIRRLSELPAGMVELVRGEQAARDGAARLAEAQAAYAQIGAAQDKLASGRAEADKGRAELEAGKKKLAEGRAEYDRNAGEAAERFADARRELDNIDDAVWYIQDRTALPSYTTIESDASSIESIATVFPLIFFTVAVLISLTTVTRMVEEDRGLIGVYKALGYSRGRILSKYLIYSFAACLAGGLAGDALGFIALPNAIFSIFVTMYELPPFEIGFNPVTAALGIVLFAVGIVGATFVACRHVLKETPASLMRPRAPRAGKRILMERITPLWRRMSFLNKVSARNLFRYKKRFLMTVFGIAGCTALMICGLGIRDTVISLKARQYGDEGVVAYDLLAVTADQDFAKGEGKLRATGKVASMLEARVDNVTAEFGGRKEPVQIVVVPRGADLGEYVKTDALDGSHLELPESGDGVLITKNMEQVLGFKTGDTVSLQDSSMRSAKVRIEGVSVSYLGNFVFMNEDVYRRVFGEQVVPNAFFANLSCGHAAQVKLADRLAGDDTFVSVNGSAKIADAFGDSFKVVDVVVYVVTIMAAALAFAVVFTLSNTNISERERELATIKVLGFRRREVHRYINKETIVLTLVGIVAGWPLGYAITRFLTYVLRMPSLFFDTIVEPHTYVFASIMSLVFTLVINHMTNKTLDRIDMVGALKSAE